MVVIRVRAIDGHDLLPQEPPLFVSRALKATSIRAEAARYSDHDAAIKARPAWAAAVTFHEVAACATS